MATLSRQPFAPLDGARLQNLTSLKNRQNAIAPAAGKRKATEITDDDFENVDPLAFSKRTKGSDSLAFFPSKDALKPSSYALKSSKSAEPVRQASRAIATPRSRTLLGAKSPVAKLNTSFARPSPLSAPAGRSPTRGKRSGLLSSRRRSPTGFSRVEPPQFNIGGAAPFSLDAALKGTIPSYAARAAETEAAAAAKEALGTVLHEEPEMKASWFFDIHEDTPEQEMTNLLQHSTCTLDISSDEESELKARRERAEGRDKENIPPVDDVSQTSGRRGVAAAARRAMSEDDMVVEKERIALGEMDPAEYYAAGCDETSVVLIASDDEETVVADDEVRDEEPLKSAEEVAAAAAPAPAPAPAVAAASPPAPSTFEFAPAINLEPLHDMQTIEELMAKNEPSAKAAVLEPIEGTGESFDLWESGSVKDDADAAAAAAAASA